MIVSTPSVVEDGPERPCGPWGVVIALLVTKNVGEAPVGGIGRSPSQ